MKTIIKLGSETGDMVFFTGNLVNKYSKENGYHGIITGWIPARSFNSDARYYVDVIKNGEYITFFKYNLGKYN